MLFWLKGVVSGARIPAPTASRHTHVAPESFWDVQWSTKPSTAPTSTPTRMFCVRMLPTSYGQPSFAIRNTVGFILRISRSISIIAIIPILQKTN